MPGNITKREGKRGPSYTARIDVGMDSSGKRIQKAKTFKRKRDAEDWITFENYYKGSSAEAARQERDEETRSQNRFVITHYLQDYSDWLVEWYLDHGVSAMDRNDLRDSRVYFVRARRSGLVKIGVASQAERRVASLINNSPEELELVMTIPGDYKVERALHREFAHLRSHGEWFRWEAEVIDFTNWSVSNAW